MNPKTLKKMLWLCATVLICSLISSGNAVGQTPGGSIVLAKCNSWVQFTVNQSSAEVIIKNIANPSMGSAMVDIYIGGSKTTSQIPKGGSIAKGGFTSTKTFKVVNIEKGSSGTTCDKRGPKDSDVRVIIPGNATSITSGNIVSSPTCGACGANFSPIRE